MAKKSADKEAPEVTPEKKPAKKSAASAEAKPKTTKKATTEESKPVKATRTRKSVQPEAEAPDSSAASPEVIEEHIRVAAYYRWVERGMNDGGHEEDWIEAEKQIKP